MAVRVLVCDDDITSVGGDVRYLLAESEGTLFASFIGTKKYRYYPVLIAH